MRHSDAVLRKDTMKKKHFSLSLICFFVVMNVVLCFSSLYIVKDVIVVDAATISGEVKILVSDANIYTDASDKADVIQTLSEGDNAFVTGEKDDFYMVFYQGSTGYILKSAIDGQKSSAENASTEINQIKNASIAASARASEAASKEAVQKELNSRELLDQSYVEAYEHQVKVERNMMIIKIIIGILVGLVIIIGIRINKKSSQST